jgi:Arc/MetJ-type ribon-helix-helix transcriptional regulator
VSTDSLPPDLSQFVKAEVASGNFASEEQVVIESLHLLRERKVITERLRVDLQAARDQFDRGEYTEYDQEGLRALFEEIKRDGRREHEARQKGK